MNTSPRPAAGRQTASGQPEGRTPTKQAGRRLLTLPEQVAERIFAAIEAGEFAPSERIREELVADQFGVSRGTVRDALRILEQDAVVCITPNRGAHVTQLSIKDVSDIFDIRRNLIGAMVRRLGPCADALIAQIAVEVETVEALAELPESTEAYLAASERLTNLLALGADNERLAEILGSLARQTKRYSKLGLGSAERRQQSARTWRTMLTALREGDLGAAAAALESLIDASRQEAVRQLQDTLHAEPTKDRLS
jgi:DNA-binding GntR family transcriptional regulator